MGRRPARCCVLLSLVTENGQLSMRFGVNRQIRGSPRVAALTTQEAELGVDSTVQEQALP